ncbi:hypothetical protein BC827DRAFT_1387035 [Russula dissimulans]|nr:hypothetical protein BC827DRAFT_1387035 [Russula dissimulans]
MGIQPTSRDWAVDTPQSVAYCERERTVWGVQGLEFKRRHFGPHRGNLAKRAADDRNRSKAASALQLTGGGSKLTRPFYLEGGRTKAHSEEQWEGREAIRGKQGRGRERKDNVFGKGMYHKVMGTGTEAQSQDSFVTGWATSPRDERTRG